LLRKGEGVQDRVWQVWMWMQWAWSAWYRRSGCACNGHVLRGCLPLNAGAAQACGCAHSYKCKRVHTRHMNTRIRRFNHVQAHVHARLSLHACAPCFTWPKSVVSCTSQWHTPASKCWGCRHTREQVEELLTGASSGETAIERKHTGCAQSLGGPQIHEHAPFAD